MIVLLTDFGTSEYVGIMKGVIKSHAPGAELVDLSHSISPQSIIEASWVLKNSYSFFPKRSIFCCVVDPGVGSGRKAVAVTTDDYTFIAPDNGLLWETTTELHINEITEIDIPKHASRTFHGRDVFAKAAAEIYRGSFKGPQTNITELNIPGDSVVRIDHFGNIVTNIRPRGRNSYVIKTKNKETELPFFETYSEGKDLFLITGSCGTLEISRKNGNANSTFGFRPGDRVEID